MAVQTHHYTIEEFEEFINLPENADRLFELIQGEIVEVPSNPYASAIASNIAFFIKLHLRDHNIAGYVTGEAGGYMVSGEPYAPDVAYISAEKQPELVRQGYNPAPPDLAVEVISSNRSDELHKLRLKITNYLAAGTTVWVAHFEDKRIEVHQPGKPVKTYHEDDILDGGDVLPGFRLPVKDIFAT